MYKCCTDLANDNETYANYCKQDLLLPNIISTSAIVCTTSKCEQQLFEETIERIEAEVEREVSTGDILSNNNDSDESILDQPMYFVLIFPILILIICIIVAVRTRCFKRPCCGTDETEVEKPKVPFAEN